MSVSYMDKLPISEPEEFSLSNINLKKGVVLIESTLENLETNYQMAEKLYSNVEKLLFRIKKCSLLDITVPHVPARSNDNMEEAACLYCDVCNNYIRFKEEKKYITDFSTSNIYYCGKCTKT